MPIDTAAVLDVVPAAARTTSGTAAIPNIAVGPTLRAQLDVTAVSGVAPTLDVVIEDTLDGTNWNTVATFAQRTAAGREVLNATAPMVANNLRVRWVVGGTNPSFTFSVKAVRF